MKQMMHKTPPAHTVSIAPMMRCTDRVYRTLMRGITRHTLLYTQMISAAAILHGNRDALLAFSDYEKPLALQIASGDPKECAHAVRCAEEYGYDEYNLNVGCPSPKIRGRFGACLMAEPQRVAQIVAAMRSVTTRPITIKHRLGIGEGTYQQLRQFVCTTFRAGACRHIVHARVAILEGLSPTQNRTIPPIQYEWVHQLKHDLPDATIEINGHIQSMSEITHHLKLTDGVMIGRKAYGDPWFLAAVDKQVFGATPPHTSRVDALRYFATHVGAWERQGSAPHPHLLMAHLAGMWHGCKGSRVWRQMLHHGFKESLRSRETGRAKHPQSHTPSPLADTIVQATLQVSNPPKLL